MPSSSRWLVLLFLLALILRLGWVITRPVQLDATLGDQSEYLGFARSLLGNGEYKHFDPRFETTLYACRSPGYPLFIAAFGASIPLIRIAQAILDTSTALAIFLLARRLYDLRTAIVAAVLVAINPFLVYFTGLILSETLYVALLAWGLMLLVTGTPCPEPDNVSNSLPAFPFRTRTITGMLLLAFSVLVRPAGLGLAILLPVIVSWHRPNRIRHLARYGLIALGTLVLVLGPWALRNRLHPQLHSWIWSTTNGGITRYDGFHPNATGASDQKEFVEQFKGRLKFLSELERDHWFAREANRWIAQNPMLSLKLAALKIARTWSPIPLSREYGTNALYVAAGLLYALPLDLLVLIGLWTRRSSRGEWTRRSLAVKALLLLPAAYFTTIHALSVGSLRYRLPAEPPMALVAAIGFVALLDRFLHAPTQRDAR